MRYDRKVCFWTYYWVYILTLVSFMDEGMESPIYFSILPLKCFSIN